MVKRDIHGLEKEYDQSINNIDEETWKHPENKQLVKEYLDLCLKGKIRSNGTYKRISKRTLYRVLGILRMLSEDWLDKNFKEATPKDWENFYDRMEEDKILSQYGKKYALSSKAKNYKTVRKFCKWLDGGDGEYPSYCRNWVVTEPKVEKPHIDRKQVQKMVMACSTTKHKAMLMMLFDGGFRIEELCNLRWVDVTKKDGKDYYKAHVRAETTKGQQGRKKPRNVTMPLATDYIDLYREECKSRDDFTREDYLFNDKYNTVYKFIKRKGKKVLNMDITPHMLRHSSANYYDDICKTYQQFCYRYGWTLSSDTAQGYWNKKSDDEIARQAEDHEIARNKDTMHQLKAENSELNQAIREQEKLIDEIQEQLEEHTNIILKLLRKEKPDFSVKDLVNALN